MKPVVGQVWIAKEQYPFGVQKEVGAITGDTVRLRPLGPGAKHSSLKIDTLRHDYTLLFDPADASDPVPQAILSTVEFVQRIFTQLPDADTTPAVIAHLLRDRGIEPAISDGRVFTPQGIRSGTWVEAAGFLIDPTDCNVKPAAATAPVVYRRTHRHFYSDGRIRLRFNDIAWQLQLDPSSEDARVLALSLG